MCLYSISLQVDILYLHNVEESQRAQLGDVAFMDRLKIAFEWLERARSQSRIQVCPERVQSWSYSTTMSRPDCLHPLLPPQQTDDAHER